jgi:hypothetical protein
VESRSVVNPDSTLVSARDSRSWVFWILGLLAILPLIAVLCSLVGKQWFPTGDLAIIDLRTRDIFGPDSPLTGLFSRRGWNHPGPAMFYLLAPFSWIDSSSASILRIGWVLIEGLILGGAAFLAWRAGKTIFFVAIITVALSFLALPAAVYRVPWNPWMPVPMLILLLVLAMRVNIGRSRDIIGLFAVGTIMIQIHASTAPLVIAVIGWAVFITLYDAVRSRAIPDRAVSTAVWCGGLSALLWFPPLLGVLSREPGNLRVLVRYFVNSPDGQIGLPAAGRIMAAQFTWVPPVLGGKYLRNPYTGFAEGASLRWLLIPVALLLGGWIIAKLTRRSDDQRLVAMAGTIFLVGIIAMSRADLPFSYTFEWRGVIAPFVVLVALVPVARLLLKLIGDNGESVFVALGLLLLVVAALVAVPRVTKVQPDETVAIRSLESFRATLLDGPAISGSKIFITSPHLDFRSASLLEGIADEIDRSGGDVKVAPGYSRAYGSNRVGTARGVDEVWSLRVGAASIGAALKEPGARLIWRAKGGDSRLDAQVLALYESLAEELRVQGKADLIPLLGYDFLDPRLKSIPGIDADAASVLILQNYHDLNDDPCRCAVISVLGGSGSK